ncbi:MAG: RNA-binding domain-containing protein [Thermoplasmata archaeon]|nr:RNA-binding domain-containing protein [Thermoplasmata archaeon]
MSEMPNVTFHWMRIQTFCYATERKELLEETMETLLGDADEYSEDESVGEHGNTMTILEARLTHQRQYRRLFSNLGPEVRAWILGDLDNRLDEDCVFYMRLDKQKAVQGSYEPAHHGDVIAITGKVQAHPARKEVAARVLSEFLADLDHSPEPSADSPE